jgi:hypothetical protein
MFAVSKYYHGSRRGAAILFIIGAFTTPLAFLWFFMALISGSTSAPHGACCVSTPSYGRAKEVRVAPIVISNPEFGNMKWQISVD